MLITVYCPASAYKIEFTKVKKFNGRLRGYIKITTELGNGTTNGYAFLNVVEQKNKVIRKPYHIKYKFIVTSIKRLAVNTTFDTQVFDGNIVFDGINPVSIPATLPINGFIYPDYKHSVFISALRDNNKTIRMHTPSVINLEPADIVLNGGPNFYGFGETQNDFSGTSFTKQITIQKLTYGVDLHTGINTPIYTNAYTFEITGHLARYINPADSVFHRAGGVLNIKNR